MCSMRGWSHSGFSIDNSVRITADDAEGMQRLVSYISRCPFSLARMIQYTDQVQVVYRAGKSECVRFPQPGDDRLREGMARNFQVFDALERLERYRLGRRSGRDARVPDSSVVFARNGSRSFTRL